MQMNAVKKVIKFFFFGVEKNGKIVITLITTVQSGYFGSLSQKRSGITNSTTPLTSYIAKAAIILWYLCHWTGEKNHSGFRENLSEYPDGTYYN